MEIEFEGLHLLALAFSFLVIILADHDGWLYFRGKKQVLDAKRVERFHRYAWIGLGGMIVTGAFLLADESDVLEEPAFYIKMFMVLALVINGVFIGRLSRIATTTPFASLTRRQKLPLLVSGAVSVTCWIGATVIGFGV
jgi:hypothetical protein